ncbi:winged helix-turn-helix transcriptional regulator [Thermococcus indicus]|uniref:Winged helix-turn-helix transcriptional regulator n=1 Tax=Thermococcus indicus TaxID=2586643 RepID=A0A4Y5SKJ1_9EURY|nr:MarR family transcriptional regulator [Thermococcus indicus]QDA30659.1 winged helix-turn-helix transcriptional regulator [Thermococcus indicus]
MRVHVLKEECENGKLVLLLRVEIEVNSLHKHELGDSERQILDLIIDNGEITQKELSQLFGRANACRAVKDLENKGLVRRERKGKTYVIRVV